MIKSILMKLGKLNSYNEEQLAYPQTWDWVADRPWFIRKILEFLCGLFVGHELSKTEYSTWGDNEGARWCRWCNKMFIVPRESLNFGSSDEFKDALKQK